MAITAISLNWIGDYADGYSVGEKGVIKIEEHRAIGEGDKWYYDVYFDNGYVQRIFTPHIVAMKESENA